MTRLLPQYSLPDYAYVPGTRAKDEARNDIPKFNYRKSTDEPYLYGVDLFNHHFYYEAHEVWEELWHFVGHNSEYGLYLKALIQLAGSKLKKIMGQEKPAFRLEMRANEILKSLDLEKFTYSLLKQI